MALATMGVIHIVATFTPLINGGLELLSPAKQQAMIYMMVQINCASIAQANEVVHQIKRFLPVTKFVQKQANLHIKHN